MDEIHEGCDECRWLEFNEFGHTVVVQFECGSDDMTFLCETCEVWEEYPYPHEEDDQAAFNSMVEQVIFLHCIPMIYFIDHDFVPPKPVRFGKTRRIMSILKESNPKWQTMATPPETDTTGSPSQTRTTLVRRLLNSPGSQGPVRRLFNSLRHR